MAAFFRLLLKKRIMIIENINLGLCEGRVQQKEKAPFVVNWQQNGLNMYKFFTIRFVCEDFKNNLIKQQQGEFSGDYFKNILIKMEEEERKRLHLKMQKQSKK